MALRQPSPLPHLPRDDRNPSRPPWIGFVRRDSRWLRLDADFSFCDAYALLDFAYRTCVCEARVSFLHPGIDMIMPTVSGAVNYKENCMLLVKPTCKSIA